MTGLLGHDEPWRIWRAAMQGDRMHHAWILAGREGVGKASFAGMAAVELVAEPGVPQPPAQSHPDIHVLTPLPANEDEARKKEEGRPYLAKRNITVEQIRAMQRRLVTRPTLGPRRAIVIDAADDMEAGAVNALLKSLEEPPQGTFFLLVAHRLGRLLPTVRSRCQIVRFQPLADSDVRRLLDDAVPGLEAATRDAAVSAAGGSPGAALVFAALDLGRFQEIAARIVTEGDPMLSLRGELASALGQRPDRDRQMAAIEAARMVLVKQLRHSDDATRLRIADAHDAIAALAAKAPVYNFEPAVLLAEIGGLLASVPRTREEAS